MAFSGAVFGQGIGIVFLDDVECTGQEMNILNCSHAGIGINNCFHFEDAGVRCQGNRTTQRKETVPGLFLLSFCSEYNWCRM